MNNSEVGSGTRVSEPFESWLGDAELYFCLAQKERDYLSSKASRGPLISTLGNAVQETGHK
jgi:hypothetical protein